MQHCNNFAANAFNIDARMQCADDHGGTPNVPLDSSIQLEIMTQEDMIRHIQEEPKVLKCQIVQPKIAASMRGLDTFSEPLLRTGAFEPHPDEFTTWAKHKINIPLSFLSAFGDLHTHANVELRICDTSIWRISS